MIQLPAPHVQYRDVRPPSHVTINCYIPDDWRGLTGLFPGLCLCKLSSVVCHHVQEEGRDAGPHCDAVVTL